MYVLKYTHVNQNHHYFVRCTNRDKDCIQKSTLKMFWCNKTYSFK